MSWRDLNVPLEDMIGVGVNARLREPDEYNWDFDDEDNADSQSAGKECVSDDEYGFRPSPVDDDARALDEEVKASVLRQDFSEIIHLYRSASSRNDMVDLFWSKRSPFPFYCPEELVFASADELIKMVNPIPESERWIYDDFLEELRNLHHLVRDDIQESTRELRASLYKNAPKFHLSSVIYNRIIVRLIKEGDERTPSDANKDAAPQSVAAAIYQTMLRFSNGA